MDKKILNKIIHSAVTSFLVLAAIPTIAATDNTTKQDNMEKCYGIVKAGLNDCATKTQSCAGSAVKDKQADAFLFVPKGLCDKIVGGSLKSG